MGTEDQVKIRDFDVSLFDIFIIFFKLKQLQEYILYKGFS